MTEEAILTKGASHVSKRETTKKRHMYRNQSLIPTPAHHPIPPPHQKQALPTTKK